MFNPRPTYAFILHGRDIDRMFAAGNPHPPTIGANRARFPAEYGAANLADARAYHDRLAARGERDES